MSDTIILSQPSRILEQVPVAYIEVDTKGIVSAVNQAACEMHRMCAEEIVGRSVWEFVPRDEAARDRIEFARIMDSGEDPPVVRRSLYISGVGYRSHELHRRIMHDAGGKPAGLSCVTFDVSELETANQESKRATLWLESAMTAIPQAVLLTDALGFVRYINTAAEALTCWPSREMLGVQIEKGMPILRCFEEPEAVELSDDLAGTLEWGCRTSDARTANGFGLAFRLADSRQRVWIDHRCRDRTWLSQNRDEIVRTVIADSPWARAYARAAPALP